MRRKISQSSLLLSTPLLFFSIVIRVNFENISNKSNVMKHGGCQSYLKNINSWILNRFFCNERQLSKLISKDQTIYDGL